ncbi:DUF371 domain-containing protein [Saccharopolyspora sp. WRP15-2]|uniref:DUF371 domain-containing protein n=1 Tax=Saccharopolyspora oryzae TaxID=2997343 RepID=A0ABT4UXA7_9PSEU|nr:DUF371 domain-containing protein [Saccharopolyspora oryzae]MDA3626338.1 DUF371 domain-containing protein [Saccharopolyspora oryzae]
MAGVLLRMTCRGHANIRATHGKTLEFAVDPEITPRATCVVGVAAEVHELDAPGIAGPVRITISAGERSATVRAVANSMWRPGSTAVVRRSSERMANTLATDADLAASTLPRELLDGLSDPESEVDITVERDFDVAGGLVFFHARESDVLRLRVEIAAASSVVVEDQAARSLVDSARGEDRRAPVIDARKADQGRLRAALEQGERVLVVSSSSTRSDVVARLVTADVPFEVIGLPAQLAVAATSSSQAPVVLVDETNRRGIVKAVRRHANAAVVFRCAADQLSGIVEDAGERGVATLPVNASERPRLGSELPSGSADVYCCIAPVDGAGEDTEVDAPRLIRSLLDQGVSQKTISRALMDSAGWSRRQAYEVVLGLTKGDSEE